MRHIVTACVLCNLLAGGAALADEKADAKEHFEAGVALQKKGDHAAAAEEFEISIGHYPNKNNLYNLANCYRVIGRPLDALATFERIKREFSAKLSKGMAADIDTQMKEINASLARLNVATVPEGARVLLNGKDLGVTPMKEASRLVAGKQTVEVTLDGHETVSKSVDLEPGAYKTLTLTLVEKKSELSIAVSEPGATVLVDGMEVGESPLDKPVALDKGDHVVKAVKDGFNPAEQAVTLGLAEARSVEMALEAIPAPEPRPVVAEKEPSSEADKPVNKKRSPLLAVGLAGTIIMAGVSAGMWGATFKNRSDHDEANEKLETDWDDGVASQRDEAGEDTRKFNKAAVATTIATGAFAALTIVGAVLKVSHNKETPGALSLSAAGLEVRF